MTGLIEMEDANAEFPQVDVTLIIGANDVTNPAAKNVKSSPIYGMPILEVDKSRMVMVIKRSMNTGFAGIDNDLYYMDKTLMLFGDAKSFVAELVKESVCLIKNMGISLGLSIKCYQQAPTYNHRIKKQAGRV